MNADNHHNILTNEIFEVTNENFEKTAIRVFQYQYENNDTYRSYCEAIRVSPADVNQLTEIPFLPIQFFKTKEIKTGNFEPSLIFESSGTTGSIPSRHFVKEVIVYEKSFMRSFDLFYGDVSNYCILGLLPSYLERKNSSLVHMVDKLIALSNNSNSGFYLYDHEKLAKTISYNESTGQKTLLIGVSYALLDFAEKFPMQLKHTIVMETGGMKGRREEISREPLHQILKERFGINEIHSEYGMTELLSQAYSKGKGIFNCPPWMKIMMRADDNPLETFRLPTHENEICVGAVNVIDLANIHSCSFIATEDFGKCHYEGSFEIIGRLENSDVRGCGLMII